MSAIDPALLQAQWLQYQNSQLAQSAIIPQAPQYSPYSSAQYHQHAPSQYLPQGEFYDERTIDAIGNYYTASQQAARSASEYIDYLQAQLQIMDASYMQLLEHSGTQDLLIQKFLFDREFTLDYIRGAWIQSEITDDFMARIAKVYLELAERSPRGIEPARNPEYSGNPNPQFTAAVVPQPAAPQNFIPPLPSSNGNATPYITMEQYLIAQQQGQVAQARAAALNNPAGLYGALFQ